MSKATLGQFYTTNYEYILQGFSLPVDVKSIIEPFCGNGDLISFVHKFNPLLIPEEYDIDPKRPTTIKRDTLAHPPMYTSKFVITNPPWIARNKSVSKSLYDLYGENDLYKCFIRSLISSGPDGGIIIVPLNFFCSIRKSDISLRKDFLEQYDITVVNVFETPVFDDTKYAACSFQFRKKLLRDSPTQFIIFPLQTKLTLILSDFNNYMIGGEVYKITGNPVYHISRLVEEPCDQFATNIVVKCLDDNKSSMIRMMMVDSSARIIDRTPRKSNRTYMTLAIKPAISLATQEQLVAQFNMYMSDMRQKYCSLFLPNFRESSDLSRKRIPFDLVYLISGKLLSTF